MRQYIIAVLYTWYIMLEALAGPVFFNWYAGKFEVSEVQENGIVIVIVCVNILQLVLLVIFWRAAILRQPVYKMFG
jgi:hypothetical protein